jgi:hypothetical protein
VLQLSNRSVVEVSVLVDVVGPIFAFQLGTIVHHAVPDPATKEEAEKKLGKGLVKIHMHEKG